MTITAKRLEELGARQHQIDAFRKIWGDGPAPMTVEAAVEHAEAFIWNWAARYLLTDAARAEYERALVAARAEFDRADKAKWAEFQRARASAWASAYAEYQRADASARADLKRACARAFATLYIAQEAAS